MTLGVVGFYFLLGFVGFQLAIQCCQVSAVNRLSSFIFCVSFRGCMQEGVLSLLGGRVGLWSSVVQAQPVVGFILFYLGCVWVLGVYVVGCHQFNNCGEDESF